MRIHLYGHTKYIWSSIATRLLQRLTERGGIRGCMETDEGKTIEVGREGARRGMEMENEREREEGQAGERLNDCVSE